MRGQFPEIRPGDLLSTDGLLLLFAAAGRAEYHDGSPRALLEWLAMAEHALRCGREPERLFAGLARRWRTSMLACVDEERARLRLVGEPRAPGPPRRVGELLETMGGPGLALRPEPPRAEKVLRPTRD